MAQIDFPAILNQLKFNVTNLAESTLSNQDANDDAQKMIDSTKVKLEK
jgi:hypothetical protein